MIWNSLSIAYLSLNIFIHELLSCLFSLWIQSRVHLSFHSIFRQSEWYVAFTSTLASIFPFLLFSANPSSSLRFSSPQIPIFLPRYQKWPKIRIFIYHFKIERAMQIFLTAAMAPRSRALILKILCSSVSSWLLDEVAISIAYRVRLHRCGSLSLEILARRKLSWRKPDLAASRYNGRLLLWSSRSQRMFPNSATCILYSQVGHVRRETVGWRVAAGWKTGDDGRGAGGGCLQDRRISALAAARWMLDAEVCLRRLNALPVPNE